MMDKRSKQLATLVKLSAAAGVMSTLAACGGSDTVYTPPAPTPAPTQPPVVAKAVSGKIVDGYIAGATITLDVNDDRICGGSDPTTVSNALGAWSFPASANPNGGDHMVCSSGGVDISSGLPVVGQLKAPPGATVVTPLTSLVQASIDNSLPAPVAGTASKPTADQLTSANNNTATALNLSGVNLSTTDPVTSTNANIIKTTAAVQTMLTQTAIAVTGAAAGTDASATTKATVTTALFANAVKSVLAAVQTTPISASNPVNNLATTVVNLTVAAAKTNTAVTAAAPAVANLAPTSVASLIGPVIATTVGQVNSASQAVLASQTVSPNNPAAAVATQAANLATTAALVAPLLTTTVAASNPSFAGIANNPLVALATSVSTSLTTSPTTVDDVINSVISTITVPAGTTIQPVSDAAAEAAAAAAAAEKKRLEDLAKAAAAAGGATGGQG